MNGAQALVRHWTDSLWRTYVAKGRLACVRILIGRQDARRPHSQDGCATKLFLVFVQLHFDSGLDLVVKRLVVLQDFFRCVTALSKLAAFVI